jgi:hypothetical protein
LNKILTIAFFVILLINTMCYSKSNNRIHFVLNPSISNLTLWRYGGGASIDLGIEKNYCYFGLSFDAYQDCRTIEETTNTYWDLDENEKDLGGAGICCKYTGLIKSKYFAISPGIRAGYWKTVHWQYLGYVPHIGQNTYFYKWTDKHVYGGPEISVKFGYKMCYLTMNDILFIGDYVSNLIKIGIEVNI